MFKTRFKKWNYSRTSNHKVTDEHIERAVQKNHSLRMIFHVPRDFYFGHPMKSLALKANDGFHIYETIFIAARDYTIARIQDPIEAPKDIARAYSAVYLMCWILSAGELDEKQKLTRQVRVLALIELMHLIPYMFMQLVFMTDGADELAKSSMALLQYAVTVATKMPGWPSRHPVRLILSNFVVLGRSEDPEILSQVAKNARECVLETCNRELGSRLHLTDRAKHYQSILPFSSSEDLYLFNTKQRTGMEKAPKKPVSQRNGLVNELQRIHRQLNRDYHQKVTTDSRGKSEGSNVVTKGLSNTSISHRKGAAEGAVIERSRVLSLVTVPRTQGSDLGTAHAQQGEQILNDQSDKDPCEKSAGNAVLVSKDSGDNITIFDQFRLFVERIFGAKLDWRPLPPLMHPLGPYQSRMFWTVSTCLTDI